VLFPTDSTSLILRLELLDNSSRAITNVPFDDADLAISYLLESGTDWVTPALVAGTIGTYIENSWVEIGQGIFQWCPPSAAVVAGTKTLVRAVYGANDPQFDSIEAVLGTSQGTGSVTVVRSIVDPDGQPVSGVVAQVSTDAAGTNVIRQNLLSDANGKITMKLDPGTYYLWINHYSYTENNPYTMEVV